MITDYLRGVFSYFEAFSYISKHNLTRYYWYCGGIGIFILIGIYLLSGLVTPILSSFLMDLIDQDISWLASISTFLIRALVLIFLFIIYKYFVLIATSPLMSKLSEDIESNMDGDFISIPFSTSKAIRDFIRSIRLSLRNVFRELFYTLLIFLVGLFPIFAIATTPFIFLVQAYFAGFGNMDFYLERYFNTTKTIEFVSDRKFFAAGNGTPYMLLLAVPVIGVFFAPVLGTTAATLEVHKRMNLE